jgi:bacteriorhodopsin
LPVPKRNYWATRENRPRFTKRFKHWTKGIAFFLNLILCLLLVDILKGNDSQVDYNTQMLLYVFSSLLMVWFGFYFVVFGVYVEKLD